MWQFLNKLLRNYIIYGRIKLKRILNVKEMFAIKITDMKHILILAIGIFSLMTGITSCHKDSILQNDFIDLSQEMGTQNDLLQPNESEIDDQIAAGLQELSTRGYPTRTWSAPKGTFPNTLTIDYGPTGVSGPYGHVRKGKLIVSLTAPLSNVQSVRTVSHENFYIDDVKVEGLVVLTNKGLNSLNQPFFERVVSNRVLTFPSGKTIGWNALQTITQTEGVSTPLILLDNVYRLEGSATGFNRKGENFTVQITDPLIYKADCPWIVKGMLTMSINSKQVTLNYGDGACNNAATVTLPDGSVREINIRRWW